MGLSGLGQTLAARKRRGPGLAPAALRSLGRVLVLGASARECAASLPLFRSRADSLGPDPSAMSVARVAPHPNLPQPTLSRCPRLPPINTGQGPRTVPTGQHPPPQPLAQVKRDLVIPAINMFNEILPKGTDAYYKVRDGTGRDGTGRDGTGRDGTGREQGEHKAVVTGCKVATRREKRGENAGTRG